MTDSHPSAQAIDRFMHGDLPGEDAYWVVKHLLDECPVCKEIAGTNWQRMVQGFKAHRRGMRSASTLSGSAYKGAIDRVTVNAQEVTKSYTRDLERGQELLVELYRHPQPRRLTLIRNSKRFRSAGLCELLISESYEQRFDDPQGGVRLGELAVAVAENLPEVHRGEPWARDLLGRAWAYLGNSHRIASSFREAEQDFETAAEAFKSGSHEELDQALLHRFRALLLRAKRQFEESYRLQDRVVQIYLRCGETRLASLVLSDKGLGLLYSGEPERALPVLQQAAELQSHLDDERSVMQIQHNLALCLCELGQYEKAQEALRGIDARCRSLGERLTAARVSWLESRIHLGLGHDRQAEAALLEARDIFIQSEIAYDAALVCLDLAACYASQNRISDVRELAEQMLPIFQSQMVHREALAALMIFREAAFAETLSLSLIEKVGTYLRAARNNPQLKWSQA